MFHMKNFVAALFGRGDTAHDDVIEEPRRLRSFDILVIAPYDDDAIVAYMQKRWLEDLSTAQVRIFLLMLDNPEGLTARWIAEHLEMTPSAVRWCLSHLKRRGYVVHGASGSSDAGAHAMTWMVDKTHVASDPEDLYDEFALLWRKRG